MFLTPHFKRFQSIRCENLKEFIENDFEKLLLVLNGFNMIDDENVVAIVCLARKYGVESVTRKCEQFLIEHSKKTPEHLTKIAEEYNLDLLKHFRKPPTVNEEIMKCLECPVCYSTYKGIPRILQCGHTFCLECLNQLHIRKCSTCWRVFAPGGHTFCNTCLKQLVSSAKCPICCKVFVPGNATLNYALMNVIDAVSPEPTNRSEQAPNTALRHQCKTFMEFSRLIPNHMVEIFKASRKVHYSESQLCPN
ncbi:unnamed protein product [Caenorhabditis brenneri]